MHVVTQGMVVFGALTVFAGWGYLLGYRSELRQRQRLLRLARRVLVCLSRGERPAEEDVRALVSHPYLSCPPASLGPPSEWGRGEAVRLLQAEVRHQERVRAALGRQYAAAFLRALATGGVAIGTAVLIASRVR